MDKEGEGEGGGEEQQDRKGTPPPKNNDEAIRNAAKRSNARPRWGLRLESTPVRIYSLERKMLSEDSETRRKRDSAFRKQANVSFREQKNSRNWMSSFSKSTKKAAKRSSRRRRASDLVRNITKASVGDDVGECTLAPVLRELETQRKDIAAPRVSIVEASKVVDGASCHGLARERTHSLDAEWPPVNPPTFFAMEHLHEETTTPHRRRRRRWAW